MKESTYLIQRVDAFTDYTLVSIIVPKEHRQTYILKDVDIDRLMDYEYTIKEIEQKLAIASFQGGAEAYIFARDLMQAYDRRSIYA